jgi:histidyl-tRNA synthetase
MPGFEREARMTEDGLRSRGMRDLGPREMRAFRAAERRFLDTAARHGYEEIRTPTIEPLHLFSGAGGLSPQLLDRVYSFLDWDGWSGERVVLRPDSTLPAARLYESTPGVAGLPARLCYVQPVYRFAPGEGEREIWQCGVELFGVPAPEGDVELLALAREFVAALGLGAPAFELAHAGLMRNVLAANGLDPAAQLAAYDRLLGGDTAVVEELCRERPAQEPALRVLFDVEGGGAGYLANLRGALLQAVPAAAAALDELGAAVAALDAAGCAYRILPGTARNFEYYTGVTFRLRAGGVECLAGGRYDGLGQGADGVTVPASGFGADLLRLAALAPGGVS